MFDNLSLLTFGGLAAVATLFATGWRQCLMIFRYISGFVLLRADLDVTISQVVRIYIKQHYRVFPMGLVHYAGTYFSIPGFNYPVLIPFRLNDRRAIYFRGFQFLFVNFGSGKSSLVVLRGFVDLNGLVDKALSAMEARRKDMDKPSDYQIYKVIGSEKSLAGAFSNRKDSPQGLRADGKNAPPPQNSTPDGINLPDIDLDSDISFRYPREFYMRSEKESDPLAGLYYDPEVLKIIDDAKRWYSQGDWYAERGIPWRRGVLAVGPMGSGKSTLGSVIAKILRIPLYQYFLATLSDQEFMERWQEMRTPCVVQWDDFGTVFNGRVSLTEHKTLTLECLLNQTSGISALPGVFLVVTSNDLDTIDPALGSLGENGRPTRPGRIDSIVRVGTMSRQNRQRMAASILRDWPGEQPGAVLLGADFTPAQFQELCIEIAYANMAAAEAPAPVCDCQNPDGPDGVRHISMECPIHNENPWPRQ